MMFETLKRLAFSDGARPASAPHLPGGRDEQRYLTAALIAAIPSLGLATHYFGPRVLYMVISAFIGGAAVEAAFGLIRKKPVGGGALVFAVLLALMLPPEIPLWMVALGAAFGTFFGKEVFGGTGDHIVSPVLVGKAFLMYSYPRIVRGSYFGSMFDFGQADAWMISASAILLGGVAMVVARESNWRIILAILASACALGWGLETAGNLKLSTFAEIVVSNGFLFGTCFLACDPAISPTTRSGKWLYGILIGSVAVLIRGFSNYTEAMMSAVLVGNLFAPVIDLMMGFETRRGTRQ